MATGAEAVSKSPDAFRTISEVAAYLETPAHVLRFWESKFPQIKPVKRAGGRIDALGLQSHLRLGDPWDPKAFGAFLRISLPLATSA